MDENPMTAYAYAETIPECSRLKKLSKNSSFPVTGKRASADVTMSKILKHDYVGICK